MCGHLIKSVAVIDHFNGGGKGGGWRQRSRVVLPNSKLQLIKNLKQNEAQSAPAESTHKGVN